jgi:glycosyltransferase involved in cell wall biosynthesis
MIIMRVLLITYRYYPHHGGAENQAKLLAEQFTGNSKTRIDIITRGYSYKFTSTNERDVIVYRLPTNKNYVGSRYQFLINVIKFVLVNRKRYHIIQVQGAFDISYILYSYIAKLVRIPILVRFASHLEHQMVKNSIKGFGGLALKIPSICAKYIAVSKSIADYMIQEYNIGSSKFEIIHNGVVIHKINIANENIRYKYSIPSNATVILCVGTFNENKNQIALIKAVEKLNPNSANVFLIFLGSGSTLDSCLNYVEEKSLEANIIFPGRISDVNSFLLGCDIFSLPSKSEGCSNAILEAMSLGKPCIVNDISSNGELVKDQVNGFLVNTDDIAEYSKKMDLLIGNSKLRESFASESIGIIKESFSIERIGTLYEKYYSKIGINI